MMVRWTPSASADLESVYLYIPRENSEAAAATVDKVLAAIEALEVHPEMGRKGRVAGTRELIVRPFVIVYRIKKAALENHATIHGSRRWPDSF